MGRGALSRGILDALENQARRKQLEEQIRQQIYRRFNKEVPYRVTQQNL